MKRFLLVGLIVFLMVSYAEAQPFKPIGGGSASSLTFLKTDASGNIQSLDPSGNVFRTEYTNGTVASSVADGLRYDDTLGNTTCGSPAAGTYRQCPDNSVGQWRFWNYAGDVATLQPTLTPVDVSGGYSPTTAQMNSTDMLYHNAGWNSVLDVSINLHAIAWGQHSGAVFHINQLTDASKNWGFTDSSANLAYIDVSGNIQTGKTDVWIPSTYGVINGMMIGVTRRIVSVSAGVPTYGPLIFWVARKPQGTAEITFSSK